MTWQGHYYSWDVRLATFSLAVLSLLLYYKRYHLTKDVILTPRCGGWINYLPVFLCCATDTPMKAVENEVRKLLIQCNQNKTSFDRTSWR